MRILTYEAVDQLLTNRKSNKDLYIQRSTPFLRELGLKMQLVKLDPTCALSLPAVTEELKSTKWDESVGPKIHQMFRITRAAAADRRLWVTLTHDHFYSHTRDRWITRNKLVGDDTIRDRFFFETPSKKRNCIGMLWWTCERLYDPVHEDPYHYAKPILSVQRLTSDLFERPSWSDNKEVTLGALDAITDVFGDLATLNTELFRDCMEVMGFLIGQLPPDILGRTAFSEVFIRELLKFGEQSGHLS